MKTPRTKPGSPLDAIYRRTDLTPEQVFQALSRLRKEAERQVEYLISLIDELDGDTDAEPEPVESNYEGNIGINRIDLDEAEGGAENHDLEAVCEDEGAEHDGTEPDEDREPSLGWTVDGVNGGVTEGGPDREADGSYLTDVARQRYRPYDRWETIRDGMHVDSERGFGAGHRRIRNLSGRQRFLVTPRIADGSGVTVSA